MAQSRELAGALQDVRKMRRSIGLRGEQDPEVVAETLNTILKEAIAVRAATGGRLGKGAVKELRNIRRALIAGQIDSGSKTAEFVGKYSAIIDQIADVETKVSKEAKDPGEGIGKAISQNLPSADMLTSALITANPLMGYSVKIAKDVFSAAKRQRQRRKELEERELENLNMEEKKLEEELSQAKEDGDDVQQNELSVKLDMIREEIHKLVEIWSDGDEKLEVIAKETEESNRLERESESASSLLQTEREYETGSFGAGSFGVDSALNKELMDQFGPRDGLFLGIGGAIGGFAGSMASKIFAPFITLYKFITKGSTILERFGRVGGLLAAAYTIYDFVDGFASAGEILEKEEGDVSISDRLRVGTASIISGLLAPIDWILDFIDLGFMEDRDSMTKDIATSQNELIQFMLSPGAWIVDFIRDFDFEELTNDLKASIMEPIDEFTEFFSRIGQAISGWIEEKRQEFLDSWLGEKLSSALDFFDTENEVTRAIDEQGTYVRGGNIEAEMLRERRRTTESPRITSQAIQAAMQVANQLSGPQASGGPPSTIVAPNNSQNNVINNTYSGPSSSLNEDRTLRRFEERSGGFMAW